MAQFWDIWASFWHPGALGAGFATKVAKKLTKGGASLQFWAPIWEAIFANFRLRGRFCGGRFLDIILERPREPENSEKGPQKAPKWRPKGSQKCTFWRSAKCELDILFAVFGAHRPSPGPDKKACKMRATIWKGLGAHFSRFWTVFGFHWGGPWSSFSALWASFWRFKKRVKKKTKKKRSRGVHGVGPAECAGPRGGFRRGQNSAERCRATRSRAKKRR